MTFYYRNTGLRDDGVLDLRACAAVRLRNLLHVLEDHSADLFGLELLLLTFDLHTDERFILRAVDDGEGPKLLVLLHNILIQAPANQSFNVIYCVCGVARGLVLRWLPDEALTIAERDVARRDVQPHVILNYVHLVLAPDADAGISRAQVYADPRVLRMCEYHAAFSIASLLKTFSN